MSIIPFTRLFDADDLLHRISTDLRAGKIVAFPTDTVWGFAVDADSRDGVSRLYALKGRDQEKPLIALLPSWERLWSLPIQLNPGTEMFLRRSWPGPLTAVLSLTHQPFPSFAHPTLGVRIPDHPDVLRFLDHHPGCLLTTSANRAGQPPATCALALDAEFGDELAWIIDGPIPAVPIPSTVLDCSSWPPQVLRQGLLRVPANLAP